MNPHTRPAELPEFDLAEYLSTEAELAEYLSIVLEEGNQDALVHALGVVARARGMSQMAADSGLTREALYKALRSGKQPCLDTISRVCKALHLQRALAPVPG